MTRNLATIIGFGAVLLWSTLAVLTVASGSVPPLLLNAICFAIGGAVGVVWLCATGEFKALRAVPLRAYVFGTVGLFGYHFLYFSALRMAPPAQAGLLNYLWPLLIVLLSGLLPGERLGTPHIVGALLAFCGAALVIGGGIGAGLSTQAALGYLLAIAAAVVWAIYSVGARAFSGVPTGAVAVFCLATSVLSALAHIGLEPTIWPQDAGQWCAVIALGLGPVGLAFFVWDIGMKRGDIQLLGVAAYAAPLLSTALLVVSGASRPGWSLLAAAVLITLGAAIASSARRKP
ncbi:membrane protein, putative [Ketogulonicigenium robustum]|uniref:Membrane protein, putative n=1 Tax=Ketogulonicigenium robustum TaxID=92947 RepID=A0A1W6NXA2_9RHOB|nr:EamA family transporter [Ketogulonicigenium robustum]ARO13730.1 membrane protein, putative [Ketogulonicigenium robustum]